MGTVEDRVTAEWNGFEGVGIDPEKRSEYLGLDPDSVLAEIPVLRSASERGCVEYKIERASETKRTLEQARYRTLTSVQVTSCADGYGRLAYVSLIRRLMCSGSLHIRDLKNAPAEEPKPEHTPDVKSIVAEVQRRVKEDPKSRDSKEIKTILVLLSRYQRQCTLALELKTRIEWAHSENERVRETLIAAAERTANQLAQAFSAELEHTRY